MFGRDAKKNQPPGEPGETNRNEGECCGGGSCSNEGAEVGDPIAAADAEIQRLRQQVEELNTKYLRTVADYQNVARRSVKDADEAQRQGTKSVILAVLPVLDHFDLALGQDVARASAEQIVSGVKVIRDELMRVLQAQGITVVSPAPDDEFDPNRHQAVMQQDAPDVRPGHIVATLKPGYALGDRVVRPAMVSLKPQD